MVHVRQRTHVGRQQRQAWPRVDGQLVARAVMPPDGLATLQGGQGDRNVFRKHIVRTPCKNDRHNGCALRRRAGRATSVSPLALALLQYYNM